MVDVSTSSNSGSINVNTTTNTTSLSVNTTSSSGSLSVDSTRAKYYEELAKQYSENALVSENNASDSANLAKDWANKLDGTVDGEEYSSKYYAELTATEAETAITNIQAQETTSIAEVVNQENTSKQNLTQAESDLKDDLDDEQTLILQAIETAKSESLSSISTNTSTSIETIQNKVSTSITAIDYERDSGITAIDNETETKKAELQPYVDSASASATSANASKERCEEILDKLGTAIKIKGRVDTFEDLPTTGNLDGDAYLVGEDGLDSYPEYYWYSNHWEFLGTSGGGGTWGTITGDITTQTDLMNKINAKQDTISDLATIRSNANLVTTKQDTITDLATIRTNANLVTTKQDIISDLATIRTNANLVTTKQDIISDLATIRSGASKGATALQSITSSNVTTALGYTPYNSTNPNGYITSSYHDSTKQDTISDLDTIRSGASKGATALQSITSSDVTTALGYTPYNSTNPNGYITSSYHDSTKQDTISDLATIRTNATNGNTAYTTIQSYGDIVTHNASEFIKSVTVTYDATNRELTIGGSYE